MIKILKRLFLVVTILLLLFSSVMFSWDNIKAANHNYAINVSSNYLCLLKGTNLTITVKLTKNGVGLPNVPIYCDDPINQQCGPFGKTLSDGKVSKTYKTSNLKPGTYVFRFYTQYTKPTYLSIEIMEPYTEAYLVKNLKIQLGTTSSLPTNNKIFGIKSGDTPKPSSKQLRDALISNLSDFMIEWGRTYFSDPKNVAYTLLVLTCLVPEATVTKAVCYYSVHGVIKNITKSAVIAFANTMIDKSNLSSADKQKMKNYVKIGNCALSIVALDPTSAFIPVDVFDASWSCAEVVVKTKKDSKGNIQSLTLGAVTTSGGPNGSAVMVTGVLKP